MGNIFISSLHKSIDSQGLQEAFTRFGAIVSCKVSFDDKGHSRGYGYVQFAGEEQAEEAIEEMDGTPLNGVNICVYNYKSKAEIQREKEETYKNVFVKGLPPTWTKDNLDDLVRDSLVLDFPISEGGVKVASMVVEHGLR